MITRLEAGALDAAFLPSLADFVHLKADPNYAALTPQTGHANSRMRDKQVSDL
jgi:hypothetical protein